MHGLLPPTTMTYLAIIQKNKKITTLTALPTRFLHTPSFSLFSFEWGEERERERGSIERHTHIEKKKLKAQSVCVCVVTYFSLSNRFQTRGEHLLSRYLISFKDRMKYKKMSKSLFLIRLKKRDLFLITEIDRPIDENFKKSIAATSN